MPLVVATLKEQIKSLSNIMKVEENQDAAIEKYAQQLSIIIDTYIKSATVIVVGTSPTGPVTGTGTIS